MRNIYSIYIINNGGIVLHASGVITRGRAYIFFGPSGSGKSTAAGLSQPGIILSDDIVVIKKTGRGYRSFGIPYWGDIRHGKGINASFEIRGLFSLVQDRAVYLERLSKIQALAEAVAIPELGGGVSLADRLLDRYIELFAQVPCYRMHFLADASFWRCIDEEFSGDIAAQE